MASRKSDKMLKTSLSESMMDVTETSSQASECVGGVGGDVGGASSDTSAAAAAAATLLEFESKDKKQVSKSQGSRESRHPQPKQQRVIAMSTNESTSKVSYHSCRKIITKVCHGKQIVGMLVFGTIGLLLFDALLRPPEERFLKPDAAAEFLKWVQLNPYWGIGAFLLVIAICVILLLPIGTPLTMGCGFIYKGVYGWYIGLTIATAVSMAGSALGAVGCFLLGRYMMRDRVRKWVRKYPLFDAIDMAVSEHGLRIMAMLYLTPVLPLGPVSYMCGSTSMALSSFILAKIASLPLMLLYVYIGAAAGTLIADAEAIENNTTLILSGIGLSAVMISCISHYIRKELMHILDRQKSAGKKLDEPNDLEMAQVHAAPVIYNEALQRRHVTTDTTESDATQKGK